MKNKQPPAMNKWAEVLAPMGKLKIGESFFINSRSTAYYYYAMRLGIKVRTKHEKEGLRIWRVA